jgi:mannose-1-phosphate guanylyltransferase
MEYAIILAGGAGTRFWPLSRQNAPKQFLNLYSDRPLIEQTITRILPLVNRNNIRIATNKIYHKKIKYYLKKLGIAAQNVLFEPEAKNTLAPIGLLSKNIFKKDNDAAIVVLPCDHYIRDKVKFLSLLRKALNLAKQGYIVTLGIKPVYPETGYGYIKVNSKLKIKNSKLYKVERFIEKPDINRAKKFLKDGRFYWNAGIFIFRADTLLREIKKYMPKEYAIIIKINNQGSPGKLWTKLSSISIDYAVMQRSKKLALVPADFGWLDLGSWKALEYFAHKDRQGNIFKGGCIDIGSFNTFAWSDNRLLATVGLNNIIIVNTKGAVLVCNKDKTQDVKKIVQSLKQKKQYQQI